MSTTISPLAPKSHPKMPAIEGVRIAAAEAGIKYKNRTDLMVMVFDEGTEVAGVFTRSKCPSAPVDYCRQNLTVLARPGCLSSIRATPMHSLASGAARQPP